MWVADNKASLVLYLLRKDGPSTTNGLSVRLAGWAEAAGVPWNWFERGARLGGRTVHGPPGYQHFYSMLGRLERRLLVVRDGRGDHGAVLYRATTKAERKAMLAEQRATCEPSASERELAEALSREVGMRVVLQLDEQPRFDYDRWWWWGVVRVDTPRGEAAVPVQRLSGPEPRNMWAEAIESLRGG